VDTYGAGYVDLEEACRAVKHKLGYYHVRTNKFGDEEIVYMSTAQMGGNEMHEFLQKVEVLMREMGGSVPERKEDEAYW
jgi:hypothetical protein